MRPNLAVILDELKAYVISILQRADEDFFFRNEPRNKVLFGICCVTKNLFPKTGSAPSLELIIKYFAADVRKRKFFVPNNPVHISVIDPLRRIVSSLSGLLNFDIGAEEDRRVIRDFVTGFENHLQRSFDQYDLARKRRENESAMPAAVPEIAEQLPPPPPPLPNPEDGHWEVRLDGSQYWHQKKRPRDESGAVAENGLGLFPAAKHPRAGLALFASLEAMCTTAKSSTDKLAQTQATYFLSALALLDFDRHSSASDLAVHAYMLTTISLLLAKPEQTPVGEQRFLHTIFRKLEQFESEQQLPAGSGTLRGCLAGFGIQ